MDLYTRVAYAHARQLTLAYSTSFGISTRFFTNDIKPHIYAIYGLVRIADEIVDTYKGHDALELLDELESATYRSIQSGYSTNPIVHAFALTAAKYNIDHVLVNPFFESMRMDLVPQNYTDRDYAKYIHGSAEVVGLMCLKVFCGGDESAYKKLEKGAAALGSAYQKVNFLRDLSADYKELGRLYFPGKNFEEFNENDKQEIIEDIQSDFSTALPALMKLPRSCKKATMMSYVYYMELLKKLESTPASTIKEVRVRVPNQKKLLLLIKTALKKEVKNV
jgi:phytoene/squalene synthetase